MKPIQIVFILTYLFFLFLALIGQIIWNKKFNVIPFLISIINVPFEILLGIISVIKSGLKEDKTYNFINEYSEFIRRNKLLVIVQILFSQIVNFIIIKNFFLC
jgi:hypothetical protein